MHRQYRSAVYIAVYSRQMFTSPQERAASGQEQEHPIIPKIFAVTFDAINIPACLFPSRTHTLSNSRRRKCFQEQLSSTYFIPLQQQKQIEATTQNNNIYRRQVCTKQYYCTVQPRIALWHSGICNVGRSYFFSALYNICACINRGPSSQQDPSSILKLLKLCLDLLDHQPDLPAT